MSKILIYDLKSEGHHIEYLHHLYLGALRHPENDFVFVVNEDFDDKSTDFQWDKSNNISFRYLDNEEGSGNVVVKAFRMSRQLRRVVKKEQPHKVFLITLMNFMPFLPFFVGKSRVSGIIYSIYLYDLEASSVLNNILNRLKYNVLSRNKHIENVFVLNDNGSTSKLNKIWKTKKFKYLTDPYIPFEKTQIHDLREELGIEIGKTMILHLGYLEERKGTMDVLDMIERTPVNDRKKYCVVFAGRIDDEIKDIFLKRIKELENTIQIVAMIGFLPYDVMGSLVFTADKVILPYKIVNASSGIIGYCAQFATPAYVPAKGLIGKLVSDYNIGVAVDKFNSFNDLENIDVENCTYCENHTVDDFVDDIFNNIN